jgi:hypothetical protein
LSLLCDCSCCSSFHPDISRALALFFLLFLSLLFPRKYFHSSSDPAAAEAPKEGAVKQPQMHEPHEDTLSGKSLAGDDRTGQMKFFKERQKQKEQKQ